MLLPFHACCWLGRNVSLGRLKDERSLSQAFTRSHTRDAQAEAWLLWVPVGQVIDIKPQQPAGESKVDCKCHLVTLRFSKVSTFVSSTASDTPLASQTAREFRRGFGRSSQVPGSVFVLEAARVHVARDDARSDPVPGLAPCGPCGSAFLPFLL